MWRGMSFKEGGRTGHIMAEGSTSWHRVGFVDVPSIAYGGPFCDASCKPSSSSSAQLPCQMPHTWDDVYGLGLG